MCGGGPSFAARLPGKPESGLAMNTEENVHNGSRSTSTSEKTAQAPARRDTKSEERRQQRPEQTDVKNGAAERLVDAAIDRVRQRFAA